MDIKTEKPKEQVIDNAPESVASTNRTKTVVKKQEPWRQKELYKKQLIGATQEMTQMAKPKPADVGVGGAEYARQLFKKKTTKGE